MAFALATALVDVQAIIAARLKDAWVDDAGQQENMIFWGNTTNQPRAGVAMLRVFRVATSDQIASFGAGGGNRRFTTLRLLISGIKNEGEGPLEVIAGHIAAKFQRQMDSGVVFMGAFGEGISEPKSVKDDARAVISLDLPYQYLVA